MVFTAGQKLRASDLNDAFAADDCEGEYNMGSDQSISTGASTPLLFGTTNRSSSLITKGTSGAGSTFTVNRDGVWACSAVIRYQSGGSSAYSGATIRVSSAPHATSAVTTSGIVILTPVIAAIRLAAGTVLDVQAYHERGVSATVRADNANADGRLYLAYLHP